MSDENTTASDESPSTACSAADALKRAKAELEKAQAFYEHVRQQATDRMKAVRESNVGDILDCTLDTVKRRPCAEPGGRRPGGLLPGTIVPPLVERLKHAHTPHTRRASPPKAGTAPAHRAIAAADRRPAPRHEGPRRRVALLADLCGPLSRLGAHGRVGRRHGRLVGVAARADVALAGRHAGKPSLRRIPATTQQRVAPRMDRFNSRRPIADGQRQPRGFSWGDSCTVAPRWQYNCRPNINSGKNA